MSLPSAGMESWNGIGFNIPSSPAHSMAPWLQGWLGKPMGAVLGSYRVPQGQLPLAHAAEAGGEDVPVCQENGAHGPGSLVGFLFLLEERSRAGLAEQSLEWWFFHCYSSMQE